MLFDTGRSQILKQLNGSAAEEVFNMLLFDNNYTLVEGSVPADWTEVSVAGYARQALSGFGAPTGPVGGYWTTVAGNVTFSNTSGGAVTVYGYVYVGATSGVYYGGNNFSAPLTLPAGGSLVFSPGLSCTTG